MEVKKLYLRCHFCNLIYLLEYWPFGRGGVGAGPTRMHPPNAHSQEKGQDDEYYKQVILSAMNGHPSPFRPKSVCMQFEVTIPLITL